MRLIGRFFSWFLRKLTFALLLVALVVAGLALGIFLRDQVDYDLRRQEIIRTLTGEIAKLDAGLAGVESRLAAARAEVAAQQDRVTQAARVVRDLEDLGGGLNRLTTDAAQLQEYDARLARMRQQQADILTHCAELESAVKRTQWEKDGLELAQARLQAQRKATEENQSKSQYYVRQAWKSYGMYVLLAAALGFLTPLGRVLAYWVLAPFAARRPPILLGAATDKVPQITGQGIVVDLSLTLGDTVWVKAGFLQGADEGLVRKSKRLLTRRIPLTCLAAGLNNLVELRHRTPAVVHRAAFADRERPAAELAIITVPEETSLIVRAGLLAGVVSLNGRKLAIRRHWRLLSLQSWLAGQFRYLEFCGPCRLLLAAGSALHPQVLARAKSDPAQAGGTGRESTAGFTPGLAYGSRRGGSFRDYFFGRSRLMDDWFAGQGVWFGRKDAAGGPVEARSFWGGLWHGALRFFGV